MSDELKRIRHALKKIAEAASEFVSREEDSKDEDCCGGAGGRANKGRAGKDHGCAQQLKLRPAGSWRRSEAQTHVYGNNVVCETDTRGYATPNNADPLRIVVDAPGGIIRLWRPNTTLNWRFNVNSMQVFEDPQGAMSAIEGLFQRAISAWGSGVPVRFSKQQSNWDFEIVMRSADECSQDGCVLASAFFPDSGRHQLVLYPKMFEQSLQEQIETLVHELGHVFGLRHFFAKVDESAWPSEIFGTHSRFSIMNYGPDSVLTSADKSDLRRLYQNVWNGTLRTINGTPIQLVKPYHNTIRS